MKLILVYVEFPEVIESVVVVVQVLLQGARHCYDRPTQQNALLIFSCWGNLITILYCLATWPAVSSPGRSVLNIHFFIESAQKRFNSIFNSKQNTKYSLEKSFIFLNLLIRRKYSLFFKKALSARASCLSLFLLLKWLALTREKYISIYSIFYSIFLYNSISYM